MQDEQQQRGCPQYVTEFNSRYVHSEQAQKQLHREHQRLRFNPWNGLLVIRFSDETTMQTNWTKLASALEKMRRDGTTVSATLQLTPTDEKQGDHTNTIGGGLLPSKNRIEMYVSFTQTRMMNEQNGRVYYW